MLPLDIGIQLLVNGDFIMSIEDGIRRDDAPIEAQSDAQAVVALTSFSAFLGYSSTAFSSTFTSRNIGYTVCKAFVLGIGMTIGLSAYAAIVGTGVIKRLLGESWCDTKLTVLNEEIGGNPFEISFGRSDTFCSVNEIEKDAATYGPKLGYRHEIVNNQTITIIGADDYKLIGEYEFDQNDLKCDCHKY